MSNFEHENVILNTYVWWLGFNVKIFTFGGSSFSLKYVSWLIISRLSLAVFSDLMIIWQDPSGDGVKKIFFAMPRADFDLLDAHIRAKRPFLGYFRRGLRAFAAFCSHTFTSLLKPGAGFRKSKCPYFDTGRVWSKSSDFCSFSIRFEACFSGFSLKCNVF